MNKKRVAGVILTATLGMGILLSNNASYKEDNITSSTEANTSIRNIEVVQEEFDKEVLKAESDKIKMATEDDKREDTVSVLEDYKEEDIVKDIGIEENREIELSSRSGSLRNTQLQEEAKELKSPEVVKELKSPEVIAKNVIDGDYGNGEQRKAKLESEGYNYEEIQAEIAKQMPEPELEVVSTESTPSSLKSNKVIKAYPHGTFKSFMRWTILNKKSSQYKLAASATKDPKTAVMKVEGRYLVALGFAYADKIGEKIDVVMESGQIIPVMVGDWKAKADTDANNSASTDNGSIIEFIVSSNSDAASATKGSGSYDTLFPGKVKEFRKQL